MDLIRRLALASAIVLGSAWSFEWAGAGDLPATVWVHSEPSGRSGR